jgi:uncharacterized cupredoxin-like copper-binding protein
MSKLHITGLSTFALCACLMAVSAQAEALVNVQLHDTGITTDLSKSMGLGMGMKADMSKAIMSISINPKSVLHGTMKFNVVNKSSNVIHEMILSPVADEAKLLAYIEKENRVDEGNSIHLGEVSELDPGKSGTLIVDVKPGKYILYCNLPGHYMAGMWTMLEVR